MKLGITPIISIIIMLGIAVALSGLAWSVLSGYTTSYTSKLIDIAPGTSFCRDGVVTVLIRNSGTTPVTASTSLIQNEQYVTDGNTIGLWHFEDWISFITTDSSNYGNIALFSDNVNIAPVQETGKFGYGLKFDGVDDILRNISAVFDAEVLNLGISNFTLEAWIKPLQNTNPAQINTIIMKGDAWNTQSGYGFGIQSNSNYLRYSENGTNAIDSNSIIKYGKWNHVAVVKKYDEAKVYIYVNGVLTDVVDVAK